jgi:hypothetical protein
MMRLINLRSHLPASLALALALMMLSGCSSTDEAAQEDTSSQSSDGVDCSTYPSPDAQAECEWAQEQINN